MRAISVLFILLFGCGGAPPPASVQPADETAITLRVRSDEPLARFACERTIRFPDPEVTPVRARSELQLRAYGAPGRWLRHRVYSRIEGVGRAPARGVSVRSVIDPRNRPLEGPGEGGQVGGMIALGLIAVERLLEPIYPARPVRVGERWTEPSFSFGPPPLDPAALTVERRFTLLAVEGPPGARVARIGWDTTIRADELSYSGVTVSGTVSITGDSTVALADGLSGQGSLDVAIDVGPSGVPDVLGRVQLAAKIQHRCARDAEPAPRALISPHRPRGARGNEP